MEAKITLYTKSEELIALLDRFADELNTVFIVSGSTVVNADAPDGACVNEDGTLAVLVEPADGCKCERCWSYSTNGVDLGEDGFLCARCRDILKY